MQSSPEVSGEYFSITGHILLWVPHYLCCMVVCAAIWQDLWNTLQHDGGGKYWNSIPNLFVTSVCFQIWRHSIEENVVGNVSNKVAYCWYHQELVCWCHLSAPRDWVQGSSHGRKLHWRHGGFQGNKIFFMHHTFCHHCILNVCKSAMLMNCHKSHIELYVSKQVNQYVRLRLKIEQCYGMDTYCTLYYVPCKWHTRDDQKGSIILMSDVWFKVCMNFITVLSLRQYMVTYYIEGNSTVTSRIWVFLKCILERCFSCLVLYLPFIVSYCGTPC